jgi:hypothetical protein
MLMYAVIGGLSLTIIALLFGLLSSYWVSVAIAIMYFLSLAMLITFMNKRGKLHEKRLLFNTGLVLHNMNYNPGEVLPKTSLVQNGYRLQLGHLCQWLEIH